MSEPNVSTVCCPAKPEERRTNQSKRAMRPLQGSSAKIEIAARSGIPSANSIVATPHCGACSLEFDLSSDEISATGGRQSFAHFDSRKAHQIKLSGFFFFRRFSGLQPWQVAWKRTSCSKVVFLFNSDYFRFFLLLILPVQT